MSKPAIEDTDSVVKRRRPQSEPALEHTVSLEVMSAWPMKCAYAVEEIYKTETDYINALVDILEGYRTPFSHHFRSDNKGHKVISTLFSNVEDLYDLHVNLLKELRSHEGDPHGFGNVFIKTESKFRQYSVYCTNYDGAIACLQSLLQDHDFSVFVSACQHNLGHMLPLSSQLIKPVQRIMRYHIMLKEVLKHFDRNHHGYQSLYKAHATMLKIGDYINEFKKQKENAERVLDLQSNTTGWSSKDVKNLSAYGELILEGSCKVGSRGIERHVVLFEKLLLILKKKDAKKYTYKGHVLTSEMHVDQKFCSENSTMIKVSSVVHSHHSFVLDLGSARKQQEWRNKMLGLIHVFIENTKRGLYKKTLPAKTLPAHEVKRRKIEEVEIGDDCMDSVESGTSKSLSFKRSKAGRLLSKKRGHSDVRSLFPEQANNSVKLQTYSVLESDMTSQSLPQLQTKTPPITTVQRLERVIDEPDTGVSPAPKPGNKRTMSGSTSMDSLLSLSDVDVAMDIQPSPRELSEQDSTTENSPARQKPMRRAAIKVKRSKTFAGGSSSAEIIKQRAREAREASMSPPRFLADALAENGREDVSDSQSNSEVGSSLLEGSHRGNLISDSMVDEAIPHRLDHEATPTPDNWEDNKVEADSSFSPERSLVHSLSPVKRPRSTSHDQNQLNEELSVSVQIIDGEEEEQQDDLELGESCGQSLLKGRVKMPGPLEGDGVTEEESQQLDEAEGGSAGAHEDSSSSWLASLPFGTSGSEDGFMIVEDSSDTEDDEEDEDEDLERAGDDIVSSLLEVADQEEASYLQESSSSVAEGTTSDQVVPQNEDVLNSSDVSDHMQETSLLRKSPSPSKSPFQLKGSASSDRAIEIYGTLPNRKKKGKSTSPLLSPSSDTLPAFTKGELSRSSIRRMEGFSRLLEFTMKQVSSDDEEDDHSATSSGISELDVSQSLPVVSKFSLDNIVEDKEPEVGENGEPISASGGAVQSFEMECSSEAPSDVGTGYGAKTCVAGVEDDYIATDAQCHKEAENVEKDTQQEMEVPESIGSENVPLVQTVPSAIVPVAEDDSITTDAQLHKEVEDTENDAQQEMEVPESIGSETVPLVQTVPSAVVPVAEDDSITTDAQHLKEAEDVEKDTQQEMEVSESIGSENVPLVQTVPSAAVPDSQGHNEDIAQELELEPAQRVLDQKEKDTDEDVVISTDDAMDPGQIIPDAMEPAGIESSPELDVSTATGTDVEGLSEEVPQVEDSQELDISEVCTGGAGKASDGAPPETSDVSVEPATSAEVEETVESLPADKVENIMVVDDNEDQEIQYRKPTVAPFQDDGEDELQTDIHSDTGLAAGEVQVLDKPLEDHVSEAVMEITTITEDLNQEQQQLPSGFAEDIQTSNVEEEPSGQDSDTIPQEVQEVIPMQVDSGFLGRWSRTFLYQIRTYVPSYKSAVLLGVAAVLAGLLFRTYFS